MKKQFEKLINSVTILVAEEHRLQRKLAQLKVKKGRLKERLLRVMPVDRYVDHHISITRRIAYNFELINEKLAGDIVEYVSKIDTALLRQLAREGKRIPPGIVIHKSTQVDIRTKGRAK